MGVMGMRAAGKRAIHAMMGLKALTISIARPTPSADAADPPHEGEGMTR